MSGTHTDRAIPPQRREAAFVRAVHGGEPFLVKTALSAGILTRQDVRSRFQRVHPRVYVRKSTDLSPARRIRAAWLWGGPGSVICGGAAAFLAGEEYFGEELLRDEVQLWRPMWRRAPDGIAVRKWPTAPNSVQFQGMAVTTPARTAIDVARHLESDVRAVAALDAMCRTGRTDPDAIAAEAFAMVGQTGVRRVLALLPSVDPKAESPKESELRLIMRSTDLPVLDSQVEVRDEHGVLVSRLDLGNREWKVGLQYDGDQHLTRSRRDGDSMAMLRLSSLGWEVRRVTQGMLHTPLTLVGFVREAFVKQGWDGHPIGR